MVYEGKNFMRKTKAIVSLIFALMSICCATSVFAEDANLVLMHFDGTSENGEYTSTLEYDGTPNRGSSRLTFKVEQAFIGEYDNYYDISFDYLDSSLGSIILQCSTTEDNVPNYSVTGYGGYVEEAGWSWADGYYYSNIALDLTATGKWKSHTFRVTDEFFTDNADNYIHFYCGRSANFGDTLTLKNIKVTKHNFKVDAIDKNSPNNLPVIGNVYASGEFGMGFSVKNASPNQATFNISYEVFDDDGISCFENSFTNVTLDSLGTRKFYLSDEFECGVYMLVVTIDNDGVIEKDEFSFCKIPEDLSNKTNAFLGINNFYGYSGWSSEKAIKDAIDAGMVLGIDDTRANINAHFVSEDLPSYNNDLGRYEYIFDKVFDTHNQKVLFTVHPKKGATYEETLNGIVENYKAIAQKYGNKIEYYEILNELNLTESFFEISPEQYAEIIVKTAIEIKKLDNDAKIVAIDSNRIPIYANGNYENYSLENSWIGRILKTTVSMDLNDDGISEDYKPLEFIDVISVHPYTDDYTTAPESSSTTKPIFEQLADLRDFIEEFKINQNISKEIPIWITEMGYQTSELNGTTENQQAAYLTRAMIIALANKNADGLNIEKFYVYALQDTGFANVHSESNYGIMKGFKKENLKGYTRDTEMAAKKSYVAVNAFSSFLNDAILLDSNESTATSDGYYKFVFETANGDKIAALWTLSNSNTLNGNLVNLPNADSINVYDICGNFVGNSLTVIDENPAYVLLHTHTPGAAATCTEAQKCTECEYVIADALGHDIAGVNWSSNGTNHWKICKRDGCNEKQNLEAHVFGSDKICDVCGYKKVVSSGGGGGSATSKKETPKEELVTNTESGETTEIINNEEAIWNNPFTDVTSDNWFCNAVEFVNKKGLFVGISEDKFGPNASMTRGMFVTVLSRIAEDTIDGTATFNDVDSKMYYAKPIAWAAEKGIVGGIGNGEFAPDKEITREEMAVILYRYVKAYNISKNHTAQQLEMLSDEKEISSWAVEAIEFMRKAEILNGMGDNKFAPNGTATRAQVAQMIMNFCEK